MLNSKRINRSKEIYNAKGKKWLLLRLGLFTYEKLVPPVLDLKIIQSMYKFQGHNGIGDLSYVYTIDPNRIRKVITKDDLGKIMPRFRIIGGDWHKKAKKHKESLVYKMMKQHFKENIDWENTNAYSKICDQIKENTVYSRLDTNNQTILVFNEYLSYLDELYEDIKTNGYKSQRELSSEKDFLNRSIPPYLNEIQVCLGPRGEIFLKAGGHRLTIAKLLGLDSVFVRTRIRHLKWQKIRDEIESNKCSSINKHTHPHFDHPEVQDLVGTL